MKRFWAEFISSLYSIKDGIIKKKQELDEERAACEAEKEELRGQIAELQQNSNNSQESVIVEPFAIIEPVIGIPIGGLGEGLSEGLGENDSVIMNVRRFDKSFIDYDPTFALYKIEDFEQANNNNDSLPVDDFVGPNNDNLSLKDNKIYFLKNSSRQLYAPNSESPLFMQFLVTNSTNLYPHYEPRPFVQAGLAFDFLDAQDYTISLESLQIEEGLEVEDLYNLYFIVGVNIS